MNGIGNGKKASVLRTKSMSFAAPPASISEKFRYDIVKTYVTYICIKNVNRPIFGYDFFLM